MMEYWNVGREIVEIVENVETVEVVESYESHWGGGVRRNSSTGIPCAPTNNFFVTGNSVENASTVTKPAGTGVMIKLPSALVAVKSFVPLTVTNASGIGFPRLSFTIPETFP